MKKQKKEVGRPEILIDWVEFDKLCGFQCTLKEIASFFDCSEDTIERAVQKYFNCNFADYFELKRGKGFASLRRRQFELAMEGNPTMLIWLGKQWLGQVERQEVTGKDGGPVDYRDISDEEIEARARKILEQRNK